MRDHDTNQRLIALLDASAVDYRLIDHTPEAVSALRGHPVSEAAKCIVLRVKVDRRTTRHVLAVVPGDRRVDLAAVRTLFAARYAGFSDPDSAARRPVPSPAPCCPSASTPRSKSSPTRLSSHSRGCTSTRPGSIAH
ncbi:YbaK/EbsC family protein [Streptomyces sp. NPDC047043]|uniref:YbaK/EbsC family protein n=1 Tax=Streptomyces sp. NPDC047043 TaxID=3154497 RepID=UPI0033FD2FE6